MSSTPGMGKEPKKSKTGPVTPKPNAVNTKVPLDYKKASRHTNSSEEPEGTRNL
jgi:hypothetical protein